MLNLRSIDLNLLTVFEAVYEERSQMKAADRLGMTQPAVSLALGRLRYLVDDRLFQGRAKGLIPSCVNAGVKRYLWGGVRVSHRGC